MYLHLRALKVRKFCVAQECIKSKSDWRSERSEEYMTGLERDISSANRTSLDSRERVISVIHCRRNT